MSTPLLSTTYFGPIQWYQKLARGRNVLVERCENFQKQTYRNRCVIATTQGRQALTVPIERGGSPLVRDIRISDHGEWRHLHWQALVSAYNESPFFEYYADDLRPFFEQRYTFLFDFNEQIRHTVCSLLDLHPAVSYTERYTADADLSGDICSYRDTIRPKNAPEDPTFTPRPYYQVFAARHGFLPNLSILDLLFNMGPEGIFWLL